MLGWDEKMPQNIDKCASICCSCRYRSCSPSPPTPSARCSARLLLRLIELIYRPLTALQLQTKKAQPKKQL